MGEKGLPVMWDEARMGQDKTMRGGDEDPILWPCPTPLPSLNTFFSLIPLISVSLSLSSKPNDGLLPAPTPPLICHHPTIMLQKPIVHFSHPPLFIRSGKILILLSLIEFFSLHCYMSGYCSWVWAFLISISLSNVFFLSFFFSP